MLISRSVNKQRSFHKTTLTSVPPPQFNIRMCVMYKISTLYMQDLLRIILTYSNIIHKLSKLWLKFNSKTHDQGTVCMYILSTCAVTTSNMHTRHTLQVVFSSDPSIVANFLVALCALYVQLTIQIVCITPLMPPTQLDVESYTVAQVLVRRYIHRQ